jgi:hypothetical protein
MGLISSIRGLLSRFDSTAQEEATHQSATIDHEYEFEHFTDAVEMIKELKRDGSYDEALDVLEWCMYQTEAESRDTGQGVAPWYYEQASIIYGKDDRYEEEVNVLERYERQKHAPGVKPEKLLTRLERARTLADE